MFWKLVMPLVKPAWMTLMLFSFRDMWSIIPSGTIFSESLKTLPQVMSTIAAGGIDEADLTLSGFVPGDEVPRETAASGVLSIHAETLRGPVRALRVYSGADVIYEAAFEGDSGVLDTEISLVGKAIGGFIRVEIEGLNEHWLCCTTPFWVI